MDEKNRAEFNEWIDWYNSLPENHQKVTRELVYVLRTAGTTKEACKMARAMIEKIDRDKPAK